MSKPLVQLNPDERIILKFQPGNNFAFYKLVKNGWPWIISGIVLYFILGKININFYQFNLQNFRIIILYALLGFIIIGFFTFKFLSSCYQYCFTDQRCIYSFQFLWSDLKMLPYNRIFNVEMKQTLLQRCFYLAEIYINTQNINNPDFLATNFPILKGLSAEAAEQILNAINSRLAKYT